MKGADAEDRALGYLLDSGHTLLARNYRIPGGEIDLVTQDAGGLLVFSEVRQRRSTHYGSAAESVTPRKLALMQRAALAYLLRERGRDDLPCRLQVIGIDGSAASGALSVVPVD
ncbi:YraN family protein [Deinococcus sp. KNUC1210]|uniref:YraN family protein n=1 Tax=Deinococcus sp. KNUC1210 TaxID=2917691 RepID=UPI001EF07B8D|nr:YraN family protein [Deinococcus sp. KNUC1210]ULH14910.1 YraN family protein [Deinococcus sp. KNUC1210]